MYLSYVLYTNIQINKILKISFQNGGNIIFYRNFLEKINNFTYKKKNDVYIIFTNQFTLNIIESKFKSKVNIYKYDVSKLRFLNIMSSINFKILKYDYSNDQNNLEIDNKYNKTFFDFYKTIIQDEIMRIIKKICTKYIPVQLDITTNETFMNLDVIFDHNIKIKYKYIIYLILKNTLITFFTSNNAINESYSWIIV